MNEIDIYPSLKDKVVITSIKLNLTKDNHHFNIDYKDLKENLSNSELSLKVISDEVIKIRQSKLPDHKSVGNCGSFFKNPIVNLSKLKKITAVYPNLPSFKIDSNNYKIPAAWLIEKSGFKEIHWKGYYVFPPFYEQVYQMLLQYIASEGSSYLHRQKRINFITKLLSLIVKIQKNLRFGFFGSVVVIRAKK